MKHLKFYKILFVVLIVSQKSYAQEKSCQALFEQTPITETQVHEAMYELKELAQRQYSQDPTEAKISKSAFRDRLKEMTKFFSIDEIKKRFAKINLIKSKKEVIADQELRDSGSKILAQITDAKLFLQDHGFKDENSLNADSVGPLQLAISLKAYEIFKSLIQMGADIELLDKHKNNALTAAVQSRQIELVELVLTRKPDMSVNGAYDVSPLMMAARMGQNKIVQLLIDHGADIHYRLPQGMNALMLAVTSRQQSTVELLLKNNADFTVRDVNLNLNALGWAKKEGTPGIVDVLIKAGATE